MFDDRPLLDTEETLRAWLAGEADLRPPGALIERVLDGTTETPRRPSWLVPERWFPMETKARFGAIPRTVVIIIILALAAATSAAISVGSQSSIDSTVPAGPGTFAAGPPLGSARASHTATTLADGGILVVGGYDASATAELFDPATAGPGPAGALDGSRYYHTATLLDDGRVLIVGGDSARTSELWDPDTASSLESGRLSDDRANHTATLLSDGRVLIVGGYRTSAEAQLWDPGTGTFEAAGSLARARGHHRAVLLPGDRVLIVGGPAEAELWDPVTKTFSPAGTLAEARWYPTATLLADGHVLVTGGGAGDEFGEGDGPLASAELWDPVTMTFAPAHAMLEPRLHHTATLLPDGRVLVVGSGGPDRPLASAELWIPGDSTFTPAASMAQSRGGHTASLLPDGRVVIIGGYGQGDVPLATTEIWSP